MSEAGDVSRKIKVVDRRRFDETGDLRPDQPKLRLNQPASRAPAEPSPSVSPREARATTPSNRPDASATPTSPLFMDLIAGLAQQAEILLTGGQGLPAQPAEARRVIEYLTVLETKTKGNLSVEEQQILSNVIFQLRSLSVQTGR